MKTAAAAIAAGLSVPMRQYVREQVERINAVGMQSQDKATAAENALQHAGFQERVTKDALELMSASRGAAVCSGRGWPVAILAQGGNWPGPP